MNFKEVKDYINSNIPLYETLLSLSSYRASAFFNKSFELITILLDGDESPKIEEDFERDAKSILMRVNECLISNSLTREDLKAIEVLYRLYFNLSKVILLPERELTLFRVLISTSQTLTEQIILLRELYSLINRRLNLENPSDLLSRKYLNEFTKYLESIDDHDKSYNGEELK